ncbi:hypothetical protein [Roseibium marinum]|uniref:hypothetical protein n=1 Tax=Roseibium marinum TaxID=281252 RepID=UPI0011AF0834|nr:hypothetical protein [Roseibium marinum]
MREFVVSAKKYGFYVFAIWICCVGAADACEVNGKKWSNSLNEILQALRSGDGNKFKSAIGKSIDLEEYGEIDSLMIQLNEYAPQGFGSCRAIMREDIPPLVTKIIFEFAETKDKGIYFYVFLVDGGSDFRSGVLKFRLSTALGDVLSDWGNS